MGAANPGGKGQGQQRPAQGGKGQGQVNPQAPMGKGQGQPMPPQSGSSSGKGQRNPNPNASQDFMNRISGPQNPLPTQPVNPPQGGKGQGQVNPPQGGKGKGQVQQPEIGANIMGGVTTPYTIGPNGQPLGGPAYANGKGQGKEMANPAIGVAQPSMPMQGDSRLTQYSQSLYGQPQPVTSGGPAYQVGQQPVNTQFSPQQGLQVDPARPQPFVQQPINTRMPGLPQNAAQVPPPPMTQQIAQPNKQQQAQRFMQQIRPGMGRR